MQSQENNRQENPNEKESYEALKELIKCSQPDHFLGLLVAEKGEDLSELRDIII